MNSKAAHTRTTNNNNNNNEKQANLCKQIGKKRNTLIQVFDSDD